MSATSKPASTSAIPPSTMFSAHVADTDREIAEVIGLELGR